MLVYYCNKIRGYFEGGRETISYTTLKTKCYKFKAKGADQNAIIESVI